MGVLLKRKEKTGDYYVIINHMKQRTSRKLGKIDRRTAEKCRRDWIKKLAMGLVDFDNGRKKNTMPNFAEFFRGYINDYASKVLKRNTWMGYRKLFERHLLPIWKNRRLDDISKNDIKNLLLEKQDEGLQINNLRICISAVFQNAVEREILPVNPARNLGKAFRGNGVSKTQPQFLTKEQVTKFLATVKKYHSEHYDFCLLLFKSGLRLGEALGLCWDCVDFDAKQIVVRRSFSHNFWDTPKSHKIRRVDISDGLCVVLQRRYQNRDENLTCDNGEELHLVFPKKNGLPINPDKFRQNIWKPMLKKAGLKPCRCHDARHTYASILLAANAPLNFVKEQLGHSSISTTVNIYGHCQAGANRSVLDSLDD